MRKSKKNVHFQQQIKSGTGILDAHSENFAISELQIRDSKIIILQLSSRQEVRLAFQNSHCPLIFSFPSINEKGGKPIS